MQGTADRRPGPDPRRYNAPLHDEVAAVFIGDDGSPPSDIEFVVYPSNDEALQILPGETVIYHGNDSMIFDNNRPYTEQDLNSFPPAGMPPFELKLKNGVTVKPLAALPDHPNIPIGSKIKIVNVQSGSETIRGEFQGSNVTIRRVPIESTGLDFVFVRNQFPIVLPRQLTQLKHTYPTIDPMIYPIIFPNGEIGWRKDMQHAPARRTAIRTKLTQQQYYCYRFAIRPSFSAMHMCGKLFQQYMVDAYVKVEGERLLWNQFNQTQLRVEGYRGLMDHIENERNEVLDPGRVVVLPSSFSGGPRAMQQNYQDAMALVTTFGKPDLFITFMCNPKCPEIVDNLLDGQQTSDRPDIVSRVFKLQLDELQKYIRNNVLGRSTAKIHVIEFQKRGLPHAHILIWLDDDSKLRTPADIDQLIRADIHDPLTDPDLYELVKTTMLHGPCGNLNQNSPCMINENCRANFPK